MRQAFGNKKPRVGHRSRHLRTKRADQWLNDEANAQLELCLCLCASTRSLRGGRFSFRGGLQVCECKTVPPVSLQRRRISTSKWCEYHRKIWAAKHECSTNQSSPSSPAFHRIDGAAPFLVMRICLVRRKPKGRDQRLMHSEKPVCRVGFKGHCPIP